MKIFNLEKSCPNTNARAGTLSTEHGKIQTPLFIPVGTYGAIKTQSSEEIQQLPSNIIPSNAYHLFLRPGTEILKKFGGIHKFMNWHKPILTDSGGFQIMSLSKFTKIDKKKGAFFSSHIDGRKFLLIYHAPI